MAKLLGGLSLFAVITIFGSTTNAERERMHDPWIGCSPVKAPSHAEGLPTNYDPNIYYNIMQLCSANNGAPRNVGCICHGEFRPIHCSPRVADSGLWWANITPSTQRFPQYCRTFCSCTSKDQATNLLEQGKHMNPAWESDGTEPSSTSSDTDLEPEVETNASYMGLSSHAGALSNTSNQVSNDQCGGKCSTNADCGGQDSGCMCSTQSEQYLPGQGVVKFVAACIIAMASNPKRGQDGPCPCNTTYVSHACCSAVNGDVQESELYKLGEILTEDDL